MSLEFYADFKHLNFSAPIPLTPELVSILASEPPKRGLLGAGTTEMGRLRNNLFSSWCRWLIYTHILTVLVQSLYKT